MKTFLLCGWMMLMSAVAWAATQTVDNFTLTYSVLGGEAKIIDCSNSSGALKIPSTLDGYPVTSIEDYAFDSCTNLTSVTIPSSVTSIGYKAFSHCDRLTSVTIPSNVTSIGNVAFEGCSSLTSFVVDTANQHYSSIDGLLYSKEGKTLIACPGGLTSVTIPEGVTSIENGAFSGCSGLTSITIPKGVTSIGVSLFYNCSSLTSVIIPEGVTSIERLAFDGCSSLTSVAIPSSVTSIGDNAFFGCSGLPKDENGVQYESAAKIVLIDVPDTISGEFVIPNSVRFIHTEAFAYCSSLTSVTIPASVTSIGEWAFCECSSLTSVTIHEGVTSIGDDAFFGCLGLPKDENGVQYESSAKIVLIDVPDSISGEFVIPDSVRFIHTEAFIDCSNLTSVTIPSSVTSIGEYTFCYCSSLTSVTIPKGVTSIGMCTFFGCSSLTSVTIPEGVTSIGDSAFSYCERLTTITIPKGVITIEGYAFSNCDSLSSVTIPSSVTSIGYYAFSSCDSLTSINFNGKPPRATNIFYSSTNTSYSDSLTGYYLSTYAEEWEAVIDSNGKWNGVRMVEMPGVELPDNLPDATGEWLTDILSLAEVTSGSVALADGTTVETLNTARLLGIKPSVTLTNDGAMVATESTFEVSEVIVVDDAVSLTVTITVEAGELPSELSLGGAVKLMMCNALGGAWTEVTPSPNQIMLKRMSNTEAELSVTQTLNTYKFFKVIVK